MTQRVTTLPDVREARAFLCNHLGREVPAVECVGEGAWSRCFGFVDRGRELVVRFSRFVDDFEKDRRAAAFGCGALPIPEVVEIGTALEGYFAISSRAHGVPLESLDLGGFAAVLPSVFRALDAARAIDLSGTSGYGGWDAEGRAAHVSWRDFLMAVDADTPEQRTHGWRKKLRESPIGDDLFRAGHTLLGELAGAAPATRSLVHGDLINANVLVSGGRISAVFDWGCSIYGDFLYDLAWLEFWSPWLDALATLDIRSLARHHYQAIGLDVPGLDARIRCCMLHIGLDHLAYNAHTGSLQDLVAVAERTAPLLHA